MKLRIRKSRANGHKYCLKLFMVDMQCRERERERGVMAKANIAQSGEHMISYVLQMMLQPAR